MTDRDWQRLSVLLGSWWPGEFDAERDKAYRLALDRFEPSDVAAALGRLLELGERFRPSAAEVVAQVTGRAQSRYATPEQALTIIAAEIRRIGCSIYDPKFPERQQAAIDRIAQHDRVVAAWAARRGLCGPGSLGAEPVEDIEIGGAVLGALRKEYRELRDQVVEREQLGQAGVTDDMLICRSTGRGGGGMAELLDRLRPAAQLEPGEEAA